ncbi:MAG: hypothetical protein ACRD6W_12495 [Nitrososphaerales archaeon]
MPNSRVEPTSVTKTPVKGIVPQLEVKFRVEFDAFSKGTTFATPYWVPDVTLAGVPVPVGSVSDANTNFFNSDPPRAQGEFSFRLLLYPHILALVSAARTGDVAGTINARFHYVILSQGAESRWNPQDMHNGWPIPLNFSRDEWNKLLDDLGYEGAWTVEIVRPAVVGWDDVESKLREAEKDVRDHQPQKAAVSCRDAWELAKPMLQDRWESVKDIINRGSKSPGSYTTKADRVASIFNDVDLLFNDIRYLADVGAHGGIHKVTDEDALLIYRLSHSILAYLSRQSRAVAPP